MTRSLHALLPLLTAALLLFAGCGGDSESAASGQEPDQPEGLTQEQLDNGIGPVSAMDLDPIDPALAEEGQKVFQTNCSACHKVDERYVGPPLGDVTERRTPAFVMNMILNPEVMIKEHPEARKLYAEYMTPMANQNLTRDQARAILEYLRTQAPSN